MKQRIAYLDVAKGLMMIIIIFNHVTFISQSLFQNEYFDLIDQFKLTHRWFTMPLYFVITGMCSNFNVGLPLFLWKNFKTLLLAGFCLSVLSVTIGGIIHPSDFSLALYKGVLRGTLYMGSCWWFLSALFVGKLLYWFLYRYVGDLVKILPITILLAFLGTYCQSINLFFNAWCFHHGLCFCFFLGVGQWVRKTQMGFLPMSLYGIAGMLMVILLWTTKVNVPYLVGTFGVTVGETPLFLLLGACGSFLFISICRLIKTSSILEFVGRNSLAVYVLHPVFAQVTLMYSQPYIDHESATSSVLFFLLAFVVSTVGGCLMAKVLDLKYFRFMLGRF